MFTKICDHCSKTIVGDCYETYANFVRYDLHFCNDLCLHEWIKATLGDTSPLLKFDREYQMAVEKLPSNIIRFKKEMALEIITKMVATKVNSPVLKSGAKKPNFIVSHKPFQGSWLLLIRFDIDLNSYESSK